MRKSLLLALSLLGLFDSTYLWWVYTSPSRPMICLGSGCDVVRASPFAFPWGIPLPAFGVAMYVTLGLLIFAEVLISEPLARADRYAIAGISGAGFLFSLYLTGIEAFVLHAWCSWCVVSAVVVTLIFALALLDIAHPLPHPEPTAALAVLRRHFAVSLAALLVGTPAFVFLARAGSTSPGQQPSPETLQQPLVRPDSHTAGNSNASVTVVEFGDIQCPVCGTAETTAREIRRKYGSQIRFVFRHFPLVSIHARAEKAAEASECAADQGKFWEGLEKFYQGQGDLSELALKRYAGELGLDVERFSRCVSSGSMAARIRRDVEDGRTLGVRGTPTFYVGSKMIEGPLELGEFARLLEQELARRAPMSVPSGQQTSTPSLRPTESSPSLSPGLLANSSTAFFTQFQTSATTCSETQAQQQQPTLIGTPEARQFFEGTSKALFVDVRGTKDFRSGRIPGAVNVPLETIEGHWSSLPKDRSIVLYESGRAAGDVCAASRAAGRVLLSHGFPPQQVKVYQDGLAGWEKAGLLVEH